MATIFQRTIATINSSNKLIVQNAATNLRNYAAVNTAATRAPTIVVNTTNPTPYGQPGGYTTGVWLVANADGSNAHFVDRAHLPPAGGGLQFYWLGANWNTANNRLGDALSKLGVTMDQATAYQDAQAAFQAAMSGRGAAKLPSQAVPSGTLLQPFNDVANAIGSVTDFFKLIGWIFHPQNILRAVEFLTGGVMIVFGLWSAIQARGEKLEGFTTSESAISRSGLGRVARDLAANTKGGRGGGGGRRVQSAPHTTRRDALRVRYQREQNIARRGENQRRFGVS